MSETTSNHKGPLALDFKSAALYTIRVVLRSSDTHALQAALSQRMKDAGALFENEAVVLDASELTEPLDWPLLIRALKSHALHPIGVVANGTQRDEASAAGLTPVDLSNAPTRPAATPAPDEEVPVVAPPSSQPGMANNQGATARPTHLEPSHVAPAAMVINRQLRSGQRVYARDTDLIVIGVVGQGAEVIADGNIHVYGPLRGKAMAGARGDTSARIFTTELDPELVAIAGVYRVIETKLEPELQNRAAFVQLQGDSLHITGLSKI